MFALTHPNEAPPTHSPRQAVSMPRPHLPPPGPGPAQKPRHVESCSPHTAHPPAGRQLALSPVPAKPSRGAPHCSWDPAQGVLNMQGNQDPLGTAAKGFGRSTQNSTHAPQFLWTNSQGSVFMWEQVTKEDVQHGQSSRGERPLKHKADQERTQGRTTPAGHTGLSALVPDYGV